MDEVDEAGGMQRMQPHAISAEEFANSPFRLIATKRRCQGLAPPHEKAPTAAKPERPMIWDWG